MTEQSGKIYQMIPKMIAKVNSITKGHRNEQQGFNYRSVDDVYGAVHPLLAEFGVFPAAEILSNEREQHTTAKGTVLFYTRLHIRYRFYADDGSFFATEVVGEGMDSGDKASNKAMSIAYKYALFQLLCIPVGHVDPDSERPELGDGGEGIKPSGGGAKYDRPDCPKCGKNDAVYKDKKKENSWYCWNKKGGCGHQWETGSAAKVKELADQMGATTGDKVRTKPSVTEQNRIKELNRKFRVCWTKEALTKVIHEMRAEPSQVVREKMINPYRLAEQRISFLEPDDGDKFSNYRAAALCGEIERMRELVKFEDVYKEAVTNFETAYEVMTVKHKDALDEKQRSSLMNAVAKLYESASV